MTKSESISVGVYLRPEIKKEISVRGGNSWSPVITRDLERLYTLYRYALREVTLTESEAWLIVDVLNGTLMDAGSAHMLWGEVSDGINLDSLDKKWEIDGPALVDKLKNLNALQCMALIDAAERFWQDESRDKDGRVGIRRYFHVG